ncbi:MAG: toxic anion resistance protein [Floccifex porci]|uniref:toxic anion resistance protein n=1 Tax=Floccifex porci TaxID=2606629 RepID=UPI0023F0548B|nr:toxic anion resistance protein [Floccifex porci]MCI7803285.1 toxic anion resistance protein [Erysipelotrichaceae bacterium]MDD7467744.1 toxic anion resistance protein [Floccifex porci]MDY4796161.1 toxic anion resistance protein [Floccifex porci]
MAEEKIVLTLNEEVEEEKKVEMPEIPQNSYSEEDILTEEQKKQVDEFVKQIDLTQSNVVLQYGSAAQRKIANFSDNTLQSVKTKDLGETGEMLSDLIVELKGFDAIETEQKGIAAFFKKQSNKASALKSKYDAAEKNVDRIVHSLEDHQIQLMKDIELLDQLYEKNMTNFKELTMYILAGKKKLKEVRENELPVLIEKAQRSGLAEDSQKANDLAGLCERFEKKIYDLELTRNVALQMGPQIRLVQNNDTLMTEKIQSTIVNTIPLWKSQMVIALGLHHSQQAIKAQQAVDEMTNSLLRKNADTLKQATIEVARESEKGIVDIETLKHTNSQLISTLDEVVKIQDEGRQKRQEAEMELARIEAELKNKLLEIHK